MASCNQHFFYLVMVKIEDMRKFHFGLYFSLLMLALFFVSGTSVYAQKPTITEYTGENNYFLNINGLGLRMIADGPETVVTNSKGQSATIAELETLGDKFEFALPITIKNVKCENTLVAIFDKSETSREDIVKTSTEYMFEGNFIRKNERTLDVAYRMVCEGDEGYISSTDISFATHHNDAQYGDRYVVKTLYDVRIIPAYVIIETKQNPSATLAAVDSVVARNHFEKELIKPDELLTKEQADSIGDGYDLLPLLLPEVAALFEKHDMKRVPSVEDGLVSLAMMYNNAAGHFPPSFAATHKDLVDKEEAKYSHSIMVPHNMPTAPMGSITTNKKPKNSRVTVTAGPAPEILGPQVDRYGNIISPLNQQRKIGSGASIQVKW